MAQAPTSPQAPPPASTPLLQGFFRLTNVQKVVLLVGVAAAVAIAVAFVSWARAPDYKVLFSNVADRDGGAIISALQQINVPYRMSEGGGAILVPSDRVYESRLRLAVSNLSVARENFAAAESRIRDLDVAEEAANLTRLTILQNAGAAVLAQANQAPALALKLLS